MLFVILLFDLLKYILADVYREYFLSTYKKRFLTFGFCAEIPKR